MSLLCCVWYFYSFFFVLQLMEGISSSIQQCGLLDQNVCEDFGNDFRYYLSIDYCRITTVLANIMQPPSAK